MDEDGRSFFFPLSLLGDCVLLVLLTELLRLMDAERYPQAGASLFSVFFISLPSSSGFGWECFLNLCNNCVCVELASGFHSVGILSLGKSNCMVSILSLIPLI